MDVTGESAAGAAGVNQADSALARLRTLSTVVADSGELAAIERYRPRDATTNPTLLLAAADQAAYAPLIAEARALAAEAGETGPGAAADWLMTLAGREIVRLIPGYVSTEVDARLSFDSEATVAHAERLLACYDRLEVPRERILIKIAATWEGVQAARALERRGIACNMTLIFSTVQAAACFDAGATLISPFVGRIADWHAARDGVERYPPEADPGVASVQRILAYRRSHDHDTWVMAASFRNTGQVLALAGCDLLTISPKLLGELAELPADFVTGAAGEAEAPARLPAAEAAFRYALNDDAMATEKLAEGIRRFAADQAQLERLLAG